MMRMLAVLGGLVIALAVAVGLFFALASGGAPVACGTGDAGTITSADFRATLDNLRNFTQIGRRLTYSEQAATLIARTYVSARNLDFTDVKIGFCNGHAEASGEWTSLGGIRGRVIVDLRAENGLLQYDVREVKVGRLPNWVGKLLVSRARREESVQRFQIPHEITTVTVGNGTLTLAGR